MKKRLLSMLLALCMALGLAACGQQTNTETPTATAAPTQAPAPTAEVIETEINGPTLSDPEYERAVAYGFAEPRNDPAREIGEKEFVDLLKRVIDAYRPEGMAYFEAFPLVQGASDDNRVFRFYAGVLLLYAAEAMDCAALPDGGYPTINQNEDWDWGAFWAMDWAMTDGWNEETFGGVCESMTKAWVYSTEELIYYHSGVNFAVSRLSHATGKPLLEFDNVNYLRSMDYLTYAEAVTAAVRLYESNDEIVALLPEDASAAVAAEEALAKAEARRLEILSSETNVTYAGTAYYVSNGGNDGADGKTPETAWATIARMEEADLQPGDAVFFRRGDVWREASIRARPYVTYSAYGEGAKPRLIASPENGSGAEKWSLLDGTNNIWVYYRDMLDCGQIVINEKAAAAKVLGWWDGAKYQHYIGPSDMTLGDSYTPEEQAAAPDFDVTRELEHDLTFFSEIVNGMPNESPLWLTGTVADEDIRTVVDGPLYLRCDTGNPGELYDSIEFLTPLDVFDNPGDGSVLDNLFIGFSGSGGVSINEGDNVTLQNCEIAWIGGCTVSYSFEDHDGSPRGALRVGGAIGADNASGTVIRDNYIHEIYEQALVKETAENFFRNRPLENLVNCVYSGNLIYHADSGMGYFNWDAAANPNHMFKNIVYEDNYVLFCGMNGWSSRNVSCAFCVEGGPNLQEGFVVRNNLFFCSADYLMYINPYPETLADFEGNEYVQFAAWPLLFISEPWLRSANPAELLSTLDDGTGTVTVLQSMRWHDLDW